MKQIVMSLMVIALIATLPVSPQAGDRTVAGLVIGGGTGAIVGHAIGHNPESTIAGAVVGGAAGILIGSAMDSHHQRSRHHARQVFTYSGGKNHPHRPQVYREIIHHHYYGGPVYRHGYQKKKRLHKSRPVFSNHFKNNRRHQRKHSSRKNHRNRF